MPERMPLFCVLDQVLCLTCNERNCICAISETQEMVITSEGKSGIERPFHEVECLDYPLPVRTSA